MTNLRQETITNAASECACDWCGLTLLEGDGVFIDLEQGTAYCSEACAEHDAFDAGYGPFCSGVSRW